MTVPMRLPTIPVVMLPPTMPAPVRAIADQWAKLNAERIAQAAELRRLQASQPSTAMGDVQAHAAALRSGRKDPGQVATAKLTGEIAEAQRQYAALTVAVGELAADLRAAGAQHADVWREQAQLEGARAAEDYRTAIAGLADARGRLAVARDVVILIAKLEAGGPMVYKSRQSDFAGLGTTAHVLAQMEAEAAAPVIPAGAEYLPVDERNSAA